MPNDWLVISIIANIVLGLSTAILTIVSINLKNKAELRSQRFTVYKEALDEIDKLNQKLSELFKTHAVIDLQAFLKQMLDNPSNIAEAIVSFNKRLYSKLAEINDVFTTSTSRLNSIRLVASNETLKLLDEYIALSVKCMEAQSNILNSINFPKNSIELQQPGFRLFDQNKIDRLSELNIPFSSIRSQLNLQMRKDIGYK